MGLEPTTLPRLGRGTRSGDATPPRTLEHLRDRRTLIGLHQGFTNPPLRFEIREVAIASAVLDIESNAVPLPLVP